MAPERSIVVFGAGAVGGYLGGKLSSAPGATPRLTLIGRPPLVEAVERNGLIVREQHGDSVSHPTIVTTAADLPRCDLLLLTVRTYDIDTAIRDIRDRLMGS